MHAQVTTYMCHSPSPWLMQVVAMEVAICISHNVTGQLKFDGCQAWEAWLSLPSNQGKF